MNAKLEAHATQHHEMTDKIVEAKESLSTKIEDHSKGLCSDSWALCVFRQKTTHGCTVHVGLMGGPTATHIYRHVACAQSAGPQPFSVLCLRFIKTTPCIALGIPCRSACQARRAEGDRHVRVARGHAPDDPMACERVHGVFGRALLVPHRSNSSTCAVCVSPRQCHS